MTSINLDKVSELLSTLHGHAYFRPKEGPLFRSLSERVLDEAEGELAEELARGFDLEVSVGRHEGAGGAMVSFSVDGPDELYDGEIALNELPDDALEDLAGYLARQAEEAMPPEPAVAGKNVVRRRPEGDHHQKDAASARLKVSPEWLKSVIPCTDYSYDEIDGKKYIRDYFWSKELIERLFKIKCTKITPEDLQYVADECCEGDMDWARDLIARLKSPNRPEPAAKEQQKNQGRPGQGQGKPAQNVAKATPAKGAPGERARSRSRHKRFRDQNRDAARKQQENPGQKPPQG